MNETKLKYRHIIKSNREELIRPNAEILDLVLKSNSLVTGQCKKGKELSNGLYLLRDAAYQEYLQDEEIFNACMFDYVPELLGFSKTDMYKDIPRHEYMQFMNQLTVSNTNSRRARAGQTLEMLVYEFYSMLNIPYVSQPRLGRNKFKKAGLHIKVDSILPSVECFKKDINKVILASIKTTLRERWQELIEEKVRTGIKKIYLVTVDEKISRDRATLLNEHKIIIVTYDWIANAERFEGLDNVISLETYFNEVVPSVVQLWD